MKLQTFRLSLFAAVFCLLVVIPALASTSTAEVTEGSKADGTAEGGSDGGSGDEDEPEESEKDLYFYIFDEDSVVTEYKAPANSEDEDKPDFLYNPQPGRARLVEFYAHWCPHCQHFRPQYNKFAKHMKELAKNANIKLDIYAVSCVPHRSICNDNDIHGYPKMKLFLGENVEEDKGIEIKYGDLHPFTMLQLITKNSAIDASAALATMDQNEDLYRIENDAVTTSGQVGDEFWIHRTKYDIYCDIYLSFTFAMEHGIFVGKDPPDEKAKEAFGNWIELVMNTLPPSWPLHTMISEIWKDMETVLDAEENLLGIVRKYPPPRKTWSRSCSRGDPAMGYTCGLWQLFHTATVGVVEWNAIGDVYEVFYRPRDVGKTIRDYVEHFFGCEVCRHNFLLEYDNCHFGRCERLTPSVGKLDDWKEVPLWLFEVHNGVNDRLLGERLEKEKRKPSPDEKTAVQWPARKDCPLCWKADGHFDYDAVLAYLKLTYWADELLTNETKKALVAATGLNRHNEDDEDDEGLESWVYSLGGVILVSFILTIISWKKQREITRTGKHKKLDDDNFV